MQTSHDRKISSSMNQLYHQQMQQQMEPYGFSPYQNMIKVSSQNGSQSTQASLHSYNDQYFTLESSTGGSGYIVYDSPSASISSNLYPFSPQPSQTHLSDPHHNAYGSPVSGSSGVDDGNQVRNILRELEAQLLGSGAETDDGCSYQSHSPASSNLTMERCTPRLDLSKLLCVCAEALAEDDLQSADKLMNLLEPMVSVTGEPIQRLGAYMLEGLRARLYSSGSIIYKKLKCKEPTGPELMSYMTVLYQICPYYKFAYNSANVTILEAIADENRIHIIDFQIAQGSQWMPVIEILANRRGGPPYIRITGVDDSQSAVARGGGLDIVGQRLTKFAASRGVQFEFRNAAMSGCEVEVENLGIRQGEALAVNFPYMLHHMPDESVTTRNHRDRLLRLVKSLSPKVVTLVEQESNTNTSAFIPRVKETLDYYNAMFESIDAARPREDKQRVSAEEHCVARDIVNIVACEGEDRVERHEPFGKWRARLTMAGFVQCRLSRSVRASAEEVLREYSKNFGLAERDGALYLGWKNRVLATSSAWR